MLTADHRRAGLWHFRGSARRFFSLYGGVVITAFLAGCAELPPIEFQLGAGDVKPRKTFAGLLAADEPEAALAAQKILRAGGNAADTAAALGLALAVTLPSSAGLGGGGACLLHDGRTGITEVLDFTPTASPKDDAARFRAATPALARGLFMLHAKYGKLPWGQVVAPAEHLARFGFSVSRALAQDLAADGDVLTSDPNALKAFMTPRRQMLKEGDQLKQPDLATLLGRMRARGPADLHAGLYGEEFEDAIAAIGANITAEDVRDYVPRWAPAAGTDEGAVRIYVPQNPIVGDDFLKVYGARETDAHEEAIAGATSFVVADDIGTGIACTLSMGKPFGIGIMPAGVGFLMAPAPDVARQPLVPVVGVDHTKNDFLFALAGAGTSAVARTAAVTRAIVTDRRTAAEALSAPGRTRVRSGLINAINCAPEGENTISCLVHNDPRGAGYALVEQRRKR